ncbi:MULTISPECIES: TetR/AcrR family transcriptional regulator [unclassified Crossiella]|uniref:TetR/AcrR family transcriptional regulator n=1 Tax=Crossiella sp. CA-258035 TaxID=2981138 RepID=UPI0024BC5454|nr:TetR/AcrR family transcriptional regulator [Crossiella sp. CA-258035]WHT22009.1 TetR/AcrR family transcriptional regulator [Crossiella sp. CA-258035]
MPKVVDHEQRRRELGRALWQVIRQHGIDGASVRSVAREAGWSPSSVQYYFTTQAELVSFAMRMISEVLRRAPTRRTLPPDPRDAAQETLERMLPMDAEMRAVAEVWVAFLSRTLVDDEARRINRGGHEHLARTCRRLLDDLAANDLLADGLDLRLEVDRLHMLMDGMVLHAVTAPDLMPPERLRATLHRHLTSLLAKD